MCVVNNWGLAICEVICLVGGNESPQIEIQVESSVSGHNNSKPVHLCLSQQLQYAKQTKTTTTVYGSMEAKYSISGHYNVFILPNTTAG